MTKKNEREIAIKTLMNILNDNAYNNIALRNCFKENQDLNKIQKAFITETVNGTLRNLIFIDYIIDNYSKTKTNKMKPFILNNLRVSVYQIYFMDKVPEHAICNNAVELTKKYGFKGLSGFVNGVLRQIIRNKEEDVLKDLDKIMYLSIKYSYQKWMIQYWLSEHTYEEVEEMCKANNKSRKINFCINTNKTNLADLENILKDEDVTVEKSKICDNSLTVSKVNDITKLKSFNEGLYHVMGETSQIAVDVLDPKENTKVLDICSAPGGKSFYMGYKMNNTGEIVSCDIYDHKIKLIDEGSKRVGLKNIETKINDATKLNNDFVNKFDYILVDAPCSGLGIVSKKPDIKLNKTFEDIEELSGIQKEIMSNAYKYLKEGGVLVYSTCTISKRENTNNVKWILENTNLELVDLNEEFENLANDKGVIEILPTLENNSDGFYIAKFRRKNNG